MNEHDNFDFTKLPGKYNNSKFKNIEGEPLISIITPYYNGDEYIEQTANSILNQTFPFWEWIIVNDGSKKKNTKEVLEKISSMDTRIKVVNKENGGPASARYLGAKHAKSNILFTLDADDIIDKTMLECGYFTLITNKEATWAYTAIATFGDNNYLYNPKFDTLLEKKENLISVASFIRKEKFLEVTEYETLPMEVHEDWYMWLTFLSKGYKPVKMNFYGFWYRRMNTGRLGTISSDRNKNKIAEKYISKVKKKVKKRVGAIQFPETCNYNYDSYPKELEYDSSIIKFNNPKTILFLFPWCVVGGADIFNLNLIKILKSRGYEIIIITTEPKKYNYRQEFEENVDAFFDLTTFLKRENWAGFISYLIKTRNIKLVFQSNSFYGYYAIPWLKSKYKDLIFVDYLHAEDWSWRDGSYPRDSIAISKFLDKTYTCTNYLKDLMVKKMGRIQENTEVSYIGTDEKFFNPDIELEGYDYFKKEYKDKKVIIFPCRIEYLKRPIFMAKIMQELKKKSNKYVCIFIGDGAALKDTKAYVKENKLTDVTHFIGMQADMRKYYKLADVMVVSSLTEGLTLTTYEALSMGVPVISSDVGGQSELVNNKTGRLIKKYQSIENDLNNYNYDKNEIKEYVDAIFDITTSKNYDKMSKYCRNLILENFSQIDCMEKLAINIENLIDTGTCVNKNYCNNLEFAERYLVLFNEYYKYRGNNPDDQKYRSKVRKIADKLWNFSFYRGIIYILQKTKITDTIKKIKNGK